MGCAGTPLPCAGISFFWMALALAVVWIFEGVIWTFAFACAGARSGSLDLSAECMHYRSYPPQVLSGRWRRRGRPRLCMHAHDDHARPTSKELRLGSPSQAACVRHAWTSACIPALKGQALQGAKKAAVPDVKVAD